MYDPGGSALTPAAAAAGAADDSSASAEMLKNSAFLLQLVCLAAAFILGLFMKKYKLTYYLHEAGATLLLGVIVGLIIWSGNTTDKARGLLKTSNDRGQL